MDGIKEYANHLYMSGEIDTLPNRNFYVNGYMKATERAIEWCSQNGFKKGQIEGFRDYLLRHKLTD